MNELKYLALKAKTRLLNKGLRNTYSTAISNEINNKQDLKNMQVSTIDSEINPIKYMLDERRMISMDTSARERYLLETIRNYQEAKNKNNKLYS